MKTNKEKAQEYIIEEIYLADDKAAAGKIQLIKIYMGALENFIKWVEAKPYQDDVTKKVAAMLQKGFDDYAKQIQDFSKQEPKQELKKDPKPKRTKSVSVEMKTAQESEYKDLDSSYADIQLRASTYWVISMALMDKWMNMTSGMSIEKIYHDAEDYISGELRKVEEAVWKIADNE